MKVRLTTATGLDDGLEYTPDGSDQEQVTNDSLNNWFPHISPDGKWIAIISFLPGEVRLDDHPFYKHVYIRVMPIEGGQPKVVAYVYGGQGTMNTPSWSQDSKRISIYQQYRYEWK